MLVRHLLHHGADAFELLNRVVHHLLQVDAIAGRFRRTDVLLDLVHVEQQRRQRSVQLARDRSFRFFRRACARDGQLDDFKTALERRDAVHPLRKVRIIGAMVLL